MFENIRLAFQGIWSHKMRSFLTMLGIIIGIASIISIVSTIQGTNEQIKNNLVGSGNNTVEIKLSRSGYDYEFSDYEEIPKGIPVVSQETLNKILAYDEIVSVSRYTSRTYVSDVYYQDTALSGAQVMGVDQNYFLTCGYTVRLGRGFLDSDLTGHKKVVLLDDTAAATLFPDESPVGKTIEIKKEPFIIVGVVTAVSDFEPVIESIQDYYTYASDSTGVVYMTSAAWPIVYQFDEPQNVVVKAATTEQMTTAGQHAADVLNATLTLEDGSDVSYKAADLLEQARQLQQLSASTNTQLVWIASISLLVGGIGVMNIMLVSVTERTSEIGLKKAIGARKRTILGQFLTEAAVLTSLGGLIGVGAGIALAEVISNITSTPVAISVPASILAVAFSMLIGIVFGMLPSWKAAQLNPIDALRRE